MAISNSDFEFVRLLVRQESAIVIEHGKEYLADSRLSPVAASHGFDSIEAMLRHVRMRPRNGLVRSIVEAMTIAETSFFRDVLAFQLLRDRILAETIDRCAATKRLTIWCGAAATGQEPYSVAMLLREHLECNDHLSEWRFQIVASDLSTSALERAKAGRYSQHEVNRGLPARLLVKYFHRVGLDWQVNDDVRSLVEFQRINLLEDWSELPIIDIALLRNVLIYFDLETKRAVLQRLREHLRPGAFALFGAAEVVSLVDPCFEALLPIHGMWCRLRS